MFVVSSVLFTHAGKKTARALYPTAQAEPFMGFSQGHFRHTTFQKPSSS